MTKKLAHSWTGASRPGTQPLDQGQVCRPELVRERLNSSLGFSCGLLSRFRKSAVPQAGKSASSTTGQKKLEILRETILPQRADNLPEGDS